METGYWGKFTRQRVGRRRLLKTGAALSVGASALALIGCGGDDDDSGGSSPTSAPSGSSPSAGASPSGGASGQPKSGGNLGEFRTGATENLNPITDTGQRLTMSGDIVYDHLVSVLAGQEYVLEAAESVEQPDPTTLVFRLKPAKFQNLPPVNGRNVTAQDVVASNYYVRDNERAVNRTFQTTSLESAEATDEQTVVFHLTAPNAYIFSGTQLVDPGGSCIMPEEILDNLDTVQVGSGPYQLTSDYQLGVRYKYERHPEYHEQGLPYIDTREFLVLTDSVAQQAAFRAEQAQIWSIPEVSLLDSLEQSMGDKIEIDSILSLGSVVMMMNKALMPQWQDVRVREAVYRLINRQQILDLVHDGRGGVPPGLLPIGLTDYQLTEDETAEFFKLDAAEARKLLEAANWDFDHEVEITNPATPPATAQYAEIMTQNLGEAGIKTRIVLLPFPEWLQGRIPTGNWETWMAGFPGWDTPQIWMRLHHTNTNFIQTYAGLKEPETDALIEKAEVTIDRDENIKVVKELQLELLKRYTPFFQVFNDETYTARYAYVKDRVLDSSSNYQHYAQMWLDL